mmetsp:Transcript_22369/g.67274  ORF Transcript_22369/g.67274 Transcript_22369/m.67274 type:complete len:225 (+) Transcript_22369:1882-2556(+)
MACMPRHSCAVSFFFGDTMLSSRALSARRCTFSVAALARASMSSSSTAAAPSAVGGGVSSKMGSAASHSSPSSSPPAPPSPRVYSSRGSGSGAGNLPFRGERCLTARTSPSSSKSIALSMSSRWRAPLVTALLRSAFRLPFFFLSLPFLRRACCACLTSSKGSFDPAATSGSSDGGDSDGPTAAAAAGAGAVVSVMSRRPFTSFHRSSSPIFSSSSSAHCSIRG